MGLARMTKNVANIEYIRYKIASSIIIMAI